MLSATDPITKLSYNEFMTEHWSRISRGVAIILADPIGAMISFQEMYAIVYKSVCNGHAETIYNALVDQCTMNIEQTNKALAKNGTKNNEEVVQDIIAFNNALENFLMAIEKICPIFFYLNKFYIDSSDKQHLDVELLDIFKRRVVEPRIHDILGKLETLLETPFAVPPDVAQALIKNIYKAFKDLYSTSYPSLFKRYIPGFQVAAPSAEEMIAESKEMHASAIATVAACHSDLMVDVDQRGTKRSAEGLKRAEMLGLTERLAVECVVNAADDQSQSADTQSDTVMHDCDL